VVILLEMNKCSYVTCVKWNRKYVLQELKFLTLRSIISVYHTVQHVRLLRIDVIGAQKLL
jgi:hypothetical protein